MRIIEFQGDYYDAYAIASIRKNDPVKCDPKVRSESFPRFIHILVNTIDIIYEYNSKEAWDSAYKKLVKLWVNGDSEDDDRLQIEGPCIDANDKTGGFC